MDLLIQDLRYGFRMLVKNPGFAAVSILTLTLGIGANTAIFSVVNAVLLRPLPYSDPDHLVMVWTRAPREGGEQSPVSLPDFKDWQEQNQSFEGMAAYAFNRFVVSGPEGSDQTRGIAVAPGFFPLIGVKPVVGRGLGEEDDREPVVVLSDSIWRRRYNSDPDAVGRSITLNADRYTIIGVMPPDFRFPSPDIELWMSFALIYKASGNPTIGDWVNSRGLRGYRVVGRLKAGVSQAEAQAEMESISQRLAQTYPDSNAGLGVNLVPLRTQMLGKVRTPLLVLLAGVGFVLLIACANVGNLMLVRTAAREREIAMRRAVGAGAARLVRQLLTESVLLGLIGGILGLLLAFWGVDALVHISPANIPRLESVAVDEWVLGFTLGVSIVAGFLFGLAPSLQCIRPDLVRSLREGARGTGHFRGRRLRSALVICEIALAFVLLIGSGLMIRSFDRLTRVDVGFPPDHLLTMGTTLVLNQYRKPEQQVAYFQQVLDRIRALPGVVAAGACTSMPPTIIQRGTGFTIEGKPSEPGRTPVALHLPMTPGYAEALGAALIEGRLFNEGDTNTSPGVAIVNETLARRFFAGESPVGHRINVGGTSASVVGVMGDVKYEGLHSPAGPQIYVPYAQSPFPGMHLVVRTAGDPLSLVSAVRKAVLEVDPNQGPTNLRTMQEVIHESIAEPRFRTVLIGIFGMLALVLASAGIYGVVAYSVTQRTHEIGVRVALGAQRRDVLRLVVRQGLSLALIGVAAGLAGALALTRLISGLLFDVSATDTATFCVISLLLVSIAMLASYIPARRATKIDPMVALRYE